MVRINASMTRVRIVACDRTVACRQVSQRKSWACHGGASGVDSVRAHRFAYTFAGGNDGREYNPWQRYVTR